MREKCTYIFSGLLGDLPCKRGAVWAFKTADRPNEEGVCCNVHLSQMISDTVVTTVYPYSLDRSSDEQV